jgi:ubiquinone/menaquinone biosynthesis C-methylase UbiE
MATKGWEPVYREKGELYQDVQPEIKKYARIFKKNEYKRILDLGCGTGRNTIYLAQQGFMVYALDISKTGVDITKKKAKALGLENIVFDVSDMKSTPYPDNYFDAVACILTLSHGRLKDNKEAIDEIYRILRPKGMLITEVMSVKDKTCGKGEKIEENTFLGGMDDDKHMMHHYFTKKEIKMLLSKFTSFKISPKTYFGAIKAFDIEAIK